jgi:AraC-like DNA-binding protein
VSEARLRLGDLSVGLISCFAEFADNAGLDATALLARYGMDTHRLAQADARLSIARYMHFGHTLRQLSGNPAIGLDAARYSRLSSLGLAGAAARHAPDIGSAMDVLTRFEPLFLQNYRGRSSVHADGNGLWLRFYSISPYNAYNCFAVDTQLAGWCRQLGEVAGCAVVPDRVQIEFAAPTYADRYFTTFDCKVEFEAPHNQIRLSGATVALPGADHCPTTYAQLLAVCERELQSRTRTYTLRERVVQLLGPLLHGSEPELDDIARQLNLPAWTLRRKLAEEGTGFRQLLADTRRDLAVAYIRDTELSFGEIAYLLGFSSAEAFQRAFKRWCNSTPGEYRRATRSKR